MRDNILFQLRNIRWLNVDHGELILTAEALGIYARRGIFIKLLALFGRMPSPVWKVAVSRISAVEIDSLGRMVIEGDDNKDAAFPIAIMSDELENLEEVAQILRDTLAEVPAWKTQEKRQLEEHRKRDRRLLAETQTILNLAKQVWEIVSALRQMLMVLRDEDWESMKITYQHILSLLTDESLSPDDHLLSSLGEAIEARSSGEVYGVVLALLRSLANVVESSAGADGESEGQSMDYTLSPGWYHLPYFLLFDLLYMESMLYNDIGDDEAVEENVPRLQRLVPILREKFNLEFEDDISDITKALVDHDFLQIEKVSSEMESYINDQMAQWEYAHD